MNIVDIHDRVATIELYPEEALVLAQACEQAAWNGDFGDDSKLSMLVETMAAAFGAMALAAGARSYIPERCAETVSFKSMMKGVMLDPGYLATADA